MEVSRKEGVFYEQSKPRGRDDLCRGPLHRRNRLSPGGTSGNPGQPTHDLLSGDEVAMMRHMAAGADRIFLACGPTDFRKQISGLAAMVSLPFRLDPFQENYVFIFCNMRNDSIKVLRYDRNGFVLATKKLLDGLKFQWPRTASEVREISF